jgi:beta-barrel assembly-enhancing protease
MTRTNVVRTRAVAGALVAMAAGGIVACTVGDDEERAIGEDAAARIEQQLPLVADADVNAYVASLGGALARGSDDRGREWRFRVVDTDQVNAFALPGGFVYVNRGLIDRTGTASELAGVLGHEIAHVLLRHSAERIEKELQTNIGVSVVCALTSICASDAARVAINVGGAAVFARFSRNDELEADSAAVDIVTRAGYAPDGIATMFAKLLEYRQERPDIVASWFGSHPLEEDRIRTVERIIARAPTGAGAALVRDDPAFHEFQHRVRELPPSPPARVPSTP